MSEISEHRQTLIDSLRSSKSWTTGYAEAGLALNGILDAEPVRVDAETVQKSAIVHLARRCLWIAFTWNDHNFDAVHKEARKEAEKWGITSFEQANEWLAAAVGDKP